MAKKQRQIGIRFHIVQVLNGLRQRSVRVGLWLQQTIACKTNKAVYETQHYGITEGPVTRFLILSTVREPGWGNS